MNSPFLMVEYCIGGITHTIHEDAKAIGGKSVYIEGPFLMADDKNRNGRVYPKRVLEKAVRVYDEEYIKQNRALGELNHPDDRVFSDMKEAALIIRNLQWEGKTVIGKALVIPSPNGEMIRILMDAGFNMGVSSRGVGTTVDKVTYDEVQDDYTLFGIDAVDGPSAQTCYVKKVLESTQWALKDNVWVTTASKDVPSMGMKAGDNMSNSDLTECFNRLCYHIATGKY